MKDTIAMVFLGKGNITLNTYNDSLLSDNDIFSDISVEEKDGKKVVSAVSTDKTTKVQIITDGHKIEKLQTTIDGSQLTESNAKAVLTKNINGILSSVMSEKDLRNIELFVAKEVLKQLKNNPDKIVVQGTFGEVKIIASGDLTTGEIRFDLISMK